MVPLDWFDPVTFFASGYPEGITSALRALPQLRDILRETVEALAPQRALEIGPGDAPTLSAAEHGAVFVDIAPLFLPPLAPRAVRGSVLALPFADDAFDVVFAADILTHIRHAERPIALREMMRLGKNLVLFNPEPGTADVEDSEVPSEPLVAQLESAGWKVDVRRFRAWLPTFVRFQMNGDYVMSLVKASR